MMKTEDELKAAVERHSSRLDELKDIAKKIDSTLLLIRCEIGDQKQRRKQAESDLLIFQSNLLDEPIEDDMPF